MRKVTLSFKSTKRDTALYNFVMSMDDKSYSIKEALRAQFADEIEKHIEKKEQKELTLEKFLMFLQRQENLLLQKKLLKLWMQLMD